LEKPPSGGFFMGVFLPVHCVDGLPVALGGIDHECRRPELRDIEPEPFIGSVDNFYQPRRMDSMAVGP
jgi:hypothetical protein